MKKNENGQPKQEQKLKKEKTQSKRKKDRELTSVTYMFVGLFTLMIGYFIYFEAVLSPDVINNPYNARQEAFAERVIRGSILSSDGTVLAETKIASDGTETRSYPYANIFSHVVGYSTRGRTGIEALANFSLLTSSTSMGEQLGNELKGEKSQGDHVITTLDFELQQAAYQALGRNRGAVVVLEADTGRILAMVSKPDFDPGRINEDWDSLTAAGDTESALYNRASQGLYAPGSTFKIVTLLEYIRENPDYKDFSFQCKGSLTEGNYTIRCYNKTAHGQEDLKKAFAKSCNSAFASIGLSLDAERFQKTCDSLLFNKELPFELTYSKSSFKAEEDAAPAEKMMTAVGQGETLVSPLHMALLSASVANDGILMKPRLLDRIESDTGSVVKQYSSKQYGTVMTPDEAEILTEYMREVTESGTGKRLADLDFPVAGKTGTAEYSSDKSKSHAWFTGFSDTGDSDIAVCVLVEEKGSGSEYAVPIAKELFAAWYRNREE